MGIIGRTGRTRSRENIMVNYRRVSASRSRHWRRRLPPGGGGGRAAALSTSGPGAHRSAVICTRRVLFMAYAREYVYFMLGKCINVRRYCRVVLAAVQKPQHLERVHEASMLLCTLARQLEIKAYVYVCVCVSPSQNNAINTV